MEHSSPLIVEANPLFAHIGTIPIDEVAAALQRWYAAHPTIRSLWAFLESAEQSIEIAIQMDPTPDGDDVSPAWLGRAARWRRELQDTTRCQVRLQHVESALCDDDLARRGTLVSAQRWRDSSYAAA